MKDNTDLIKQLNKTLATASDFYINLKVAHWNVVDINLALTNLTNYDLRRYAEVGTQKEEQPTALCSRLICSRFRPALLRR